MRTVLLVLCVSVVVVVGYLAVFFILQHSREMETPYTPPPSPNFSGSTISYQDEKGRIVERERRFEVSTELANPELMKKLPPPPAVTTTETPLARIPAGAAQ
jgi:hypothetical protein